MRCCCWGCAVPAAGEAEAEGDEGTAAGPCTHRLAVQALQVDDEGLVVILAPGDLGERRGSLAQQVVLRELADRNGTIVSPTPLAEIIAPHLKCPGLAGGSAGTSSSALTSL